KASALQRQAVGQRQLVGGEHRLLGEPERQRRLLGDAGGELECPADGLGGRRQLGRQAGGDRLGRRERLAGKDQLHRQRLADQARQQLGAAGAGQERQVDLGLTEAGVV